MEINNSIPSTPKASSSKSNYTESIQVETPARQKMRVRNPFDQQMVERLHLPIIDSPLFQVPPQMSSTVFEWTIDDVSSLKPVHLEAHETQFQDSPDPDLEAKAQSAISSYFKEQVIVPSPIDCPLRKNRIIISEMNGVTPIANKKGYFTLNCSSSVTRNVQTQTQLSLPPILPAELEKMLSEYMQPCYAQSACSTPTRGRAEDMPHRHVNQDVSLRRKLFDKQNVILLDQTSSTPTQNRAKRGNVINGNLSENFDKSYNMSLSPLSDMAGLSSPDEIDRSHKRKAPYFAEQLNGIEDLSPIKKSSPKSSRTSELTKCPNISMLFKYRNTAPDWSYVSVISNSHSNSEANDTGDISVLVLRSQPENMSSANDAMSFNMSFQDLHSSTNLAELSNGSNDSVVEFSNTPHRVKRGKTKSKNLSHSFSALIDVSMMQSPPDNVLKSEYLKTDVLETGIVNDCDQKATSTGDSGFYDNCTQKKSSNAGIVNDDDVIMN